MIKQADFIKGNKDGKVPDSTLIKMAAFRNELEKAAESGAFFQALKGALSRSTTELLPSMLVGGGMLGIGSALHEGIKALEGRYQDYKLSQEKQPAFDAMLLQHPDLKEKEELAKVYYDALWHYSPIMAKEPLSAGAYIKNALNMHHVAQGPLPSVVKEIVDIAKAHAGAMGGDGGEGGTLSNVFVGLKSGPGAFAVPAAKSEQKKIYPGQYVPGKDPAPKYNLFD